MNKLVLLAIGAALVAMSIISLATGVFFSADAKEPTWFLGISMVGGTISLFGGVMILRYLDRQAS